MKDQAHPQELDFELKFDFPNALEGPLLDAVRGRCRPDPSYPEGYVSSIYYDTRDLDLLAEKLNSDFLKTKVRLRWYELDGAAQGDASFIELKRRVGTRRSKIRVRAPFSAATLGQAPLEAAQLQAVETILLEAGIDTPRSLFPMFTVRYHRRRFVDQYTGARVAIDCRIEVPRINHRFLRVRNPARLDHSVLEVKGAHRDLPITLRIITDLGCRKSSRSKYATCHQHLESLHN